MSDSIMSTGTMTVQSTPKRLQIEAYSSTLLDSSTADSSASDSDHGYITPAEHFADDEQLDEQGAHQVHSHAAASVGTSSATDEIVVIEPELKDRIVRQVEWYFSDENLLKDSFLMKHINRNKQGYVSLKLVASLRKVKALTKDWHVVLMSVKQSSELALNEEETKVRRVTPAPQVDFSHIGRTVLVTNYPHEVPTVQNVEQRFGKYGDVTLVRILHPGRAIPLDVKPCRAHHTELGKEVCVLVEFESEEGAKIACKKFLEQQSWRDELKVVLLDTKKSSSKDKDKEQSNANETSQGKSGYSDDRRRRKRNDHENKQQQHTMNSRRGRKEESPLPNKFVSEDSRQHRKYSPPSKYSPPNTPNTSSKYSPPSLRARRGQHSKGTPEMSRKFLHPEAWREYSSDSGCNRSSGESPKSSPEPMKRFFSGELAQSWRRNTEKHVHVKDSLVIRQPLGPDGTRGFVGHRRPVQISVQAC